MKSLRRRDDIVIKPADKGGAAVVRTADLYGQVGLRQLNETTFHSKLDFHPTFSKQKIVKTTIKHFIQGGDLLASAKSLLLTTPRSSSMFPTQNSVILIGQLFPPAVTLLSSFSAI